jgi:hypothetical protein
MTGDPTRHMECNAGWDICTCGSGAHPRPCDLHPDAYEAHVTELASTEDDAPPAPERE